MQRKTTWSVLLLAAAMIFATTRVVEAQATADAILDKLVAKGILKPEEAQELKSESTNNPAKGVDFKISHAIKSVELYGDVRFRYEYRSGKLGPEAGQFAGDYDTASRMRYAVRLGLRGDLVDDFYYGLRLETGPNERSTFQTFGNASGGQSPYYGPFSKANNYSLFIGQAYLGWRPTSWLDVSVGRVPQPLYTTPMVWDSDYCPEGLVEKFKYTWGPVEYFATFGQYIYQDTTPANAEAVEGGNSANYFLGDFSDQNAYLLAWQIGGTYHLDTNISFKVAPIVYTYVGHGNQSSGFYGPFIGQGINGFTYNTNSTSTSSVLPGGSGATSGPGVTTTSYNQTGINNLSIIEIPMELNFKLGHWDAKAFGDWAINLQGDARAQRAYNAGEAIAALGGNPNPFPGGPQFNQDQAMQFGVAIGNNLGLVYQAPPKKGTWEARIYWQHVEQYALDPNLLDSEAFEGRGNLQGIFAQFAYSFNDAMIGSVGYGWAERINNQLGTGGFNADLPLPNPITKFQLFQVNLTWRL
jgi:hypothetical protein